MQFGSPSKTIMLLAGLGLVLASSGALAKDQVRLNFGVYSSNKPSAMVKIFQPTLRALEKRMSVKLNKPVDVRLQIAKDYDQGISHLTSGKVDFSRFGPASYIEAKRINQDLRILAMESKDNEKVFYGIIAVHKDSDIYELSQLKGKSFAFGDEGSTIGRFLSQLHLEQNGIRAANLSGYEYLGRHDKVGTAVGAGDYSAGALNESTFKKLVDAGEPIRELARFPNVTKPWIARAGLDPIIFNALKESLLEITEESALKGLKTGGFLEGSDTDYQEIRTAMENNDAFFDDPVEQTTSSARNAHFDNAGTGVNTGTGKREPAINAARSAEPVTSTELKANITQAGTPVNTQPMRVPVAQPNAMQTVQPQQALQAASNVTINISIPQSFLSSLKPGSDGNSQLTINLTIPEAVRDSSTAMEAADAGEM